MSLLDRLLGRITIDTFARDLIKAAARAGQRGWRYVPELKELRAPNDRGRVLLHNLFLEYSSAAPDSRQALMNKYVGLMVSSEQGPPRSWTEACNAIYPMIRGRWDMMPLEIAHRGKDGARLPPRIELPWCESLILRIAYDSPSAALPIGHDEIQSWGVSVEQALEQAMDNLRALPAPRWRELVPSVFYLESPMHYEEAMLLRDDVVSSCPVKGMPVFIASNRGIVLATGTDEPNGVATMLTQAAYSYQNRPWPMSPSSSCAMAISSSRTRRPASTAADCAPSRHSTPHVSPAPNSRHCRTTASATGSTSTSASSSWCRTRRIRT